MSNTDFTMMAQHSRTFGDLCLTEKPKDAMYQNAVTHQAYGHLDCLHGLLAARCSVLTEPNDLFFLVTNAAAAKVLLTGLKFLTI